MIKTGKRKLLKKEKARDFADGPVVKTLCSWCRGQGQGREGVSSEENLILQFLAQLVILKNDYVSAPISLFGHLNMHRILI